jgi:hypothetical protein
MSEPPSPADGNPSSLHADSDRAERQGTPPNGDRPRSSRDRRRTRSREPTQRPATALARTPAWTTRANDATGQGHTTNANSGRNADVSVSTHLGGNGQPGGSKPPADTGSSRHRVRTSVEPSETTAGAPATRLAPGEDESDQRITVTEVKAPRWNKRDNRAAGRHPKDGMRTVEVVVQSHDHTRRPSPEPDPTLKSRDPITPAREASHDASHDRVHDQDHDLVTPCGTPRCGTSLPSDRAVRTLFPELRPGRGARCDVPLVTSWRLYQSRENATVLLGPTEVSQ